MLEPGYDEERFAGGRNRQAGEPLQRERVVPGQPAQVRAGRHQQQVDPGLGGGLLGLPDALPVVERRDLAHRLTLAARSSADPDRVRQTAAVARGRLLLLDFPSLYFRAFYGVPETVTAPDGTPVNAVRGTIDFTARLVRDRRPTRIVAAMDADWRPAWRVAA